MAIGRSSADVIASIDANTAAFKSGINSTFGDLGRLDSETAKTSANMQRSLDALNLGVLSNKLGQATRAIASFANDSVAAASQVEQFGQTLKTLEGSSDAGQASLKKLADFAASTPFELPDVVRAGVQLRTLGADVDRFLPLAGDLAVLFQRSIPDASRALAKALGGSQDGITQLQDSFGITKRELVAAGASMKSGGAIALDTAKDLEALANAIEKVAKQKNFSGAMTAQLDTISGKLSQLSDAVFKAESSIGAVLAPAFGEAVVGATNLINSFSGLDKSTQALIATGVGVAGFVTAAATAFTGFLAILPAVQAGAAAVGFSLSSLLGPFGLLAAAVVTLTGLYAKLRIEQALNEEQNRKEIQQLNELAGAYRKVKDARITAGPGATSEQLVDAGINTKDIDLSIKNVESRIADFYEERAKLEEKAQRARELQARKTNRPESFGFQEADELTALRQELSQGAVLGPATLEGLQKELAVLKQQRAEVGKIEQDRKKAAANAPKAEAVKKAQDEALKEDLKRFEIQKIEQELSAAEQAKILEGIVAKNKEAAERRGGFEVQLARLAKQSVSERASEEKKAADAVVQQADRAFALRKAKGEASLADEVAFLQRRLALVKGNADEEFRTQQQLNDALVRSEQEKQQRLEQERARLSQSKQAGQQLRKGGLDTEIAAAEKSGDTAKAAELIQERQKATEEIIKLQLREDLAAEKSASVRVQLEKNAQEQIRQERERTAQQLEALKERETREVEAAQSEANRLRQQAIGGEVSKAAEKGDTKEVERLLKERQALTEEAINAELEAQLKATTSAEARAQLEQNAQEKIRQERQKTADEFKRLTDQEIGDAQRKADALNASTRSAATTDITGGAISLQQLGEQLSATFGKSAIDARSDAITAENVGKTTGGTDAKKDTIEFGPLELAINITKPDGTSEKRTMVAGAAGQPGTGGDASIAKPPRGRG